MLIERIRVLLPSSLRMPVAAILVSIAYFMSGKLALSLSFKPDYISALWPPNGIVLAALLLTNPRQWWWYILAMVPAELAADLPSGISLTMALAFVVADTIEVFIAAILLRYVSGGSLKLNNIRSLIFYVLCGVVIAPFIAAFFGAYVPALGKTDTSYLIRWRTWFMSDALTHFVITPFIFLWLTWDVTNNRDRTLSRIIEIVILMSGILIFSFYTFSSNRANAGQLPSLYYAPLPFLLWASIRFGVRGIFTASLLFIFISLWSTSHGHGPFTSPSQEDNVFNLQIFHFLALSPLLLLSIVIEERKMGEEHIRDSEERFRQLAENINEVFYISNLETHKMMYVSRGYELIWGRSRESLYADPMSFVEAIHDDDRERVLYSLKTQLQGEKTEEVYRIFRPDKTMCWIRDRAFPVKDAHGVIVRVTGIAEDITKYRNAEETIKESQEHYRLLLDTSPDAIVETGLDGKILFCNQQASNTFGYESPAELIGQDSLQSMFEEDIHIAQKNAALLLDKGYFKNLTYRMRKKDGTPFPVEVNATLVRDVEGNPKSFLGSIRDITERKTAEKKLKESESKFLKIAENIRDVFWLFDWKHKKVIYVSPAYKTVWGRSMQDLYDRYEEWAESIHPDDIPYAQESFEKIIGTGGGEPREYRIIRPDGSIRWISDRGFAIKGEDGNVMHITGIAEDITERKKLEEELQKSHKLESLGILAGGIAHDFNNLLTGIMNNIYLSKMHLEKESTPYRQLESAEKAVVRGSELTQQLLTFSRGGAPVKRTSSISDLIKEVAGFALRGSNIKCKYRISENIWPVDVDKGQISQVIQNIIINAEQSMPRGGTILIKVENALSGSVEELPLSDGRYVKITINDQGIGISEDNLQKIFDPYFTTKELGRGLGLAIAYSIVKNHNGRISVESELGHGTTFDIYLPASEQQIVTQEASEDSDQTGEWKVLIMDDEEFIRSSLGEILVHKGYEVEFASDGAEAIEIYKKAMESSKTFDVVILDLTVPGGMGGEEAIKKIREIDANVKAIVSSGYSNNPILANFRDYGFRGVLSKPYNNPAALNKVLHNVIRNFSE